MQRALNAQVLVAAVGSTSASALHSHGVEPDAIPSKYVMASLVETILEHVASTAALTR